MEDKICALGNSIQDHAKKKRAQSGFQPNDKVVPLPVVLPARFLSLIVLHEIASGFHAIPVVSWPC